MNPPRANVTNNEIVFTYERTSQDTGEIKGNFERDLSNLRGYVQQIAKDIEAFNAALRERAKQRIEARREKLLADQGLASDLGFPIKRREDTPQTYVAPTQRKKPPAQMPKASSSSFAPEPTLDGQEYEHILSVISNMVLVIERSPKAFQGMGEEDLRQHFLVQLNGQYDGQATGETFNFEGKIDILIRAEGRNIFIAECKFWNGPDAFKKTIDQLLGYVSWRDTKTAIVVFNRNRNFSTVLEGIPKAAKDHPNYKRELPGGSETRFRYVFGHRDDPNRELTLTVLAFEVPSATSEAATSEGS